MAEDPRKHEGVAWNRPGEVFSLIGHSICMASRSKARTKKCPGIVARTKPPTTTREIQPP